jgi:hypothetical protein
MDEGLRVGDRAFLDEISPELARKIELDVNLQCL